MELIEGIKTRRSIRGFKPDTIPEDIMKKVLETAGKSPSYTNTQPWEVAVVSGKKRDELSRILLKLAESDAPANPDIVLPKVWPPALEQRAKEHGARRFKALGIERENAEQRKEMRLRNFYFYGAPTVLFLFMERSLTSWSIFDMGLFTQSLCLAAHSFGLSTCLQASLAYYPDAVREFLGIPEEKMLVIGISIGYPDYDAPLNSYHSTRVAVDDFVKWYG